MIGPYQRVVWRGRLLHPWRRRRFAAFGAGSVIHRPAWLMRTDLVAVGAGVLALHDLWLAVEPPAWAASEPVVRIGDGAAIRPHVTISAAESVLIEEDVVLSAFVTVIDSDHTYRAGRRNVLHNPLDSGPVRIGAGSWVGERSAVLRGADIGRCCIIGTNSVVRGEIPDFSVAVGAPARVVGSTREQFPPGTLPVSPA